MDKPVNNFNFQTMEYALYTIRENHAMTSTLKS